MHYRISYHILWTLHTARNEKKIKKFKKTCRTV